MPAMPAVNGWSSRTRGVLAFCALAASCLVVSVPALGQDTPLTTMTGTVVSYNKNTLIVKDENNHYRLFVFDRHTSKPETLATGSGVRVTSAQTEDPQVRLAVVVVSAPAPAPAVPSTPEQDIVPGSIRTAESAIERDAKKFHFGVQAGVALDPELMDVGIHAKFGPFFTKNVQFRP